MGMMLRRHPITIDESTEQPSTNMDKEEPIKQSANDEKQETKRKQNKKE